MNTSTKRKRVGHLDQTHSLALRAYISESPIHSGAVQLIVMQLSIADLVALATDLVQPGKQRAELIEVLQPCDVFVFDLLSFLGCPAGSRFLLSGLFLCIGLLVGVLFALQRTLELFAASPPFTLSLPAFFHHNHSLPL